MLHPFIILLKMFNKKVSYKITSILYIIFFLGGGVEINFKNLNRNLLLFFRLIMCGEICSEYVDTYIKIEIQTCILYEL